MFIRVISFLKYYSSQLVYFIIFFLINYLPVSSLSDLFLPFTVTPPHKYPSHVLLCPLLFPALRNSCLHILYLVLLFHLLTALSIFIFSCQTVFLNPLSFVFYLVLSGYAFLSPLCLCLSVIPISILFCSLMSCLLLSSMPSLLHPTHLNLLPSFFLFQLSMQRLMTHASVPIYF